MWALANRASMILVGMQYYAMLGALTQARNTFEVSPPHRTLGQPDIGRRCVSMPAVRGRLTGPEPS